MDVLVLRPERAATRTADGLAKLGHRAVLAPVLTIEDLESPIPAGRFDAVLATSANGLRKLARRPEMAALGSLPLIAVGDRTAAAGHEAGFTVVHVADGDGRALVAEARARFAPGARFLHAAGADRAFDVAGALARDGFATEVVELYAATPATTLPLSAAAGLRAGSIGAALHHSRRIAETFIALADQAGLGAEARALPHLALAQRVAGALLDAGCPRVVVAPRPDEPSLFEALAALVHDGSHSGGGRSK
ncbi:uroporphyrinogen-III synthase [Hansschlegelia sp. KR7-227]|uniref:uroporphyrinogen-III synthase n=1 Tax=Hansschlegelia sp. KR7-227 TaxID=3400914 RepID=UPI003BFF7C71